MTPQTAVLFDIDGFRAWLHAPNEPHVEGSATNVAVSPLLSAAYQRLDGDAGWLVETTLDMLRSVTQRIHPAVPVPWAYGDGVADVRVWATADEEGGPDGGLAGEVTVDRVVLSLGRLDEKDLVPPIYDVLPGYEAAEHALAAVAKRVNHVAARFRVIPRGKPVDWPFGSLGYAEITKALQALAQMWRSARTGTPKRVPLSAEHRAVADAVLTAADAAEVIDAEVVDGPVPSCGGTPGYDAAYQAAAAAVDGDVNHPAHPTHW